MKKIKKRSIAALCLVMLLTGGTLTKQQSPIRAALTDATVQSYEQQLEELAVKKQQALNRLSEVRGDLTNAQTTKQTYDELVELSIKKKNLAMQQLDSITEQIKVKKADIEETTKDIERQQKAFLDRMVTMYEEGEASYLELLLGAESLVDFLTRMDQVATIQEYDQDIIRGLEENKNRLEKDMTVLEHSLALQGTTQAELELDIKEAMSLAEESLKYMEELKQDESAYLAEYYKNKNLEDELNKKLEAYLKELQAKQQAEYVGGSMGWPLPIDVYYRVSSEYGWRTLWGMQDNHRGIDLACAANTPIYAANAGKVIVSEYHYSYGNYVIIDHGGGRTTLYAHMNERLVAVNDTVAKGEKIGLVGTTGSSTGNHLHFEVRIDGKTDNPRNYINLP